MLPCRIVPSSCAVHTCQDLVKLSGGCTGERATTTTISKLQVGADNQSVYRNGALRVVPFLFCHVPRFASRIRGTSVKGRLVEESKSDRYTRTKLATIKSLWKLRDPRFVRSTDVMASVAAVSAADDGMVQIYRRLTTTFFFFFMCSTLGDCCVYARCRLV